MKAILWLAGLVGDLLKWVVTMSVVGLFFGFFHYIGWDAARTLLPVLIPLIQEVIGK